VRLRYTEALRISAGLVLDSSAIDWIADPITTHRGETRPCPYVNRLQKIMSFFYGVLVTFLLPNLSNQL